MNLARFRELFAVGNPDAYALQREDGSYLPARFPLTDDMLERHLWGQFTVGVYTVRPGTSDTKLLVWDFDSDDLNEARWRANKLIGTINDLGVEEWVVEFSGRKGFHVWLFLEDYMPASVVRRAGLGALQAAGLPMSTEVFPKQDKVEDLGNLVKLPLGIHRVSGQLSEIVAGDLDTVGLTTKAEVIRLAGLWYEPPRPPAREVPQGRSLPPCMTKAVSEGVGAGKRHHTLFGLFTELRTTGVELDDALAVALAANDRFRPPFAERTVRYMASNIYRQTFGFKCSADYLHDPDELLCSKSCNRYQPLLGAARDNDG